MFVEIKHVNNHYVLFVNEIKTMEVEDTNDGLIEITDYVSKITSEEA